MKLFIIFLKEWNIHFLIKNIPRFYCGILITALLTGCSFAPKYERPEMIIPEYYKESDPWVIAKPSVANADCPTWWEIFDDPILNALEEALIPANQDLKIALAQYEGALAQLQISTSELYPTLDGVGQVTKNQFSKNVADPLIDRHFNNYLLGTTLSYEIDLWGQVRNTVKASKNLAMASYDQLAAVQLSLQTTLASTYFSLRGAEAKVRLFESLTVAYEKALALTKYRFEGGIDPEIAVFQAQTQLENVKTLATDAKLQRANFEHAIAVLVGEPPAAFSLEPSEKKFKVVELCAMLPSTLLQRRPDIAAAERQVQAANATIGVARAAFFPNINLLGTILGFESSTIGTLLQSPSFYWTVGPTATQVIFDGGNLLGQLNQAKASYHQTVANYRQTVLNALQEVEDNLASQQALRKEEITQTAAAIAAHHALDQANYMYAGGIATFLDVVIEENQALNTDIALVDIQTRRQVTTVQLIKALGGGWPGET